MRLNVLITGKKGIIVQAKIKNWYLHISINKNLEHRLFSANDHLNILSTIKTTLKAQIIISCFHDTLSDAWRIINVNFHRSKCINRYGMAKYSWLFSCTWPFFNLLFWHIVKIFMWFNQAKMVKWSKDQQKSSYGIGSPSISTKRCRYDDKTK